MSQIDANDAHITLHRDLTTAERFLHLSNLLFQPPRSDAHVIHPYMEGLFRLIDQAATTVSLAALRRCFDTHNRSLGLGRLAKHGVIPNFALSEPAKSKIETLIDQSLAHADPAALTANWWKQAEVTRGELRRAVREVREAIDSFRSASGLPAIVCNVADIDDAMDRLLDDIHLADHARCIRDRVESNAPVDPRWLLQDNRPTAGL